MSDDPQLDNMVRSALDSTKETIYQLRWIEEGRVSDLTLAEVVARLQGWHNQNIEHWRLAGVEIPATFEFEENTGAM